LENLLDLRKTEKEFRAVFLKMEHEDVEEFENDAQFFD